MATRARWDAEGTDMNYRDGIQLLERIDSAMEFTRSLAGQDDGNSTQATTVSNSWLRLLCFAYARGILESQDIWELSHDQPWLLGPTPSRPPHPNAIMHFRRENRERLEKVLAQVLATAGDSTVELNRVCGAPTSEAMVRAGAILNIARHLDSCE